MFIQYLAGEANTQVKLDRKPRKNVQYKDVGTSTAIPFFRAPVHRPRANSNFTAANAVSHQDNLEFLEDTVPKTVPFKKVKATANATQARLRGEKVGPDEGMQAPVQQPTANGNANVVSNGDGATFSVPIRADERQEDPNDQLEQEMRQAGTPRDNDVSMSG